MAREYVNVNRNENLYTPEQWREVKAQMPRRKWGIRVMSVIDSGNYYGFRYPSRWRRFVDWWAEL